MKAQWDAFNFLSDRSESIWKRSKSGPEGMHRCPLSETVGNKFHDRLKAPTCSVNMTSPTEKRSAAAVIKLHRRIFSRRVSRYQARCRAHGKSIITHQASFPPAEWGTNNIMLAPNEKSSPDVSLPKKPETGDWHSYYFTFSTSYFPPHTFSWVYAHTTESRGWKAFLLIKTAPCTETRLSVPRRHVG